MAEIYRSFYEPHDRQIEIIAQDLIPKRNYLLISPKGVRSFDLALDPVTLSFVGASTKEDIYRVRQLSEQHGAAWPAYWLRDRGLPEAADEFERLAPAEPPGAHAQHYINGAAGSSARRATEASVTP